MDQRGSLPIFNLTNSNNLQSLLELKNVGNLAYIHAFLVECNNIVSKIEFFWVIFHKIF